MALSTINVQSFASPASSHMNDASFELQDELPDITQYLTPYFLKTLEMLHTVHGTTDVIQNICLSLSYRNIYSTAYLSNTRSTITLEEYNMKHFTDSNPLPSRLPFIADHCSTVIPQTCDKHGHGVMNDVVEAMRRTTHFITDENDIYAFIPPTTQDIQTFLSSQWPHKYPPARDVASGWRNTVNQCLTHGQGWNFLTFPPIDGSKNKRHLLFERAFNGSYIVGSGQCKGLNDMKPKYQNRTTSPMRRQQRPRQLPTPPTTPESTASDMFSSSPTEWCLSRDLRDMSPGELRPTDGLGAVEAGLVRMFPNPDRESGEVCLRLKLIWYVCYRGELDLLFILVVCILNMGMVGFKYIVT